MDSLSLILRTVPGDQEFIFLRFYLGWPTPLLPLKVAEIQSLICYHYSLKKREGKLSVELPHGQFFLREWKKERML